jgi:hypothetical protein
LIYAYDDYHSKKVILIKYLDAEYLLVYQSLSPQPALMKREGSKPYQGHYYTVVISTCNLEIPIVILRMVYLVKKLTTTVVEVKIDQIIPHDDHPGVNLIPILKTLEMSIKWINRDP